MHLHASCGYHKRPYGEISIRNMSACSAGVQVVKFVPARGFASGRVDDSPYILLRGH